MLVRCSMPEALRQYITLLPNDTAEELWVWLDGNPDAIGEMVEAICEPRHWGVPVAENIS